MIERAPVPNQAAAGEATRLLPRTNASPATVAQAEITRDQMINAYPIPGLKTAFHYFFTVIGFFSFSARDESKIHYSLRQLNPSSANKWLSFQLFVFVILAATKAGLTYIDIYSNQIDPSLTPPADSKTAHNENVAGRIAVTVFVEVFSLLATLIVYDMARTLIRSIAYSDAHETLRNIERRNLEAGRAQVHVADGAPPPLPGTATPPPAEYPDAATPRVN